MVSGKSDRLKNTMLWEDVGSGERTSTRSSSGLSPINLISAHRPPYRQRAFIAVANRALTYIHLPVGYIPLRKAYFRGNQIEI